MRIAALISGGKDSLFAAYKALKQGNKLKCLISIKAKRKDSYMFHIPNIELTKLQAELMNIPIIFVESSGEKEKELDDLRKAIKQAKDKYKIEGVVSGAIASQYQKERVDKICSDLKLESIAPLWHVNPAEYLDELLAAGFEVIIVGIAAEGFNKKWLGKRIDLKTIDALNRLHDLYKVSVIGEGGEFESFVLDCPLFNKRIIIKESEIIMEDERTGHLEIKKYELIEK
jgi:asparagine synthase (glutamine-hydrolysing)